MAGAGNGQDEIEYLITESKDAVTEEPRGPLEEAPAVQIRDNLSTRKRQDSHRRNMLDTCDFVSP